MPMDIQVGDVVETKKNHPAEATLSRCFGLVWI